jgi:outer membrane protein assembly factor BamB
MSKSKLLRSGILVACLAALAAGCCYYEESFIRVADGMDQKVDETIKDMNEAVNRASAALEASAQRYEEQYKEYKDLLVAKYQDHHQPCELVFFERDGLAPAEAGRVAPSAEEAAAAATPREIEAPILGERVLEHRGLHVLWKLALDGSPARYAYVDGEQLYVVTRRNRIYSIERRTGLTRWVTTLRRRPDSPPGFNDAYVVISAGDEIHVIDKLTGRDKWRFETNIQPASRPYTSSVGFVYGCWDGTVAGFQWGERFPRWKFRATDRVFAAPYVHEADVFAAADDGKLTRYNKVTGVGAKIIRLGARPANDIIGANDMLYVGTHDFDMLAIRRSDLSTLWTHSAADRVIGGPWLSSDRRVLYYSARKDGLYALTAATGRQRWHIPGGLRPVGRTNDRLFVLSSDGALSLVDAGTGKAEWSEKIEPFVTAVDHVADKTVYLLSDDGQIYAIAPR